MEFAENEQAGNESGGAGSWEGPSRELPLWTML